MGVSTKFQSGRNFFCGCPKRKYGFTCAHRSIEPQPNSRPLLAPQKQPPFSYILAEMGTARGEDSRKRAGKVNADHQWSRISVQNYSIRRLLLLFEERARLSNVSRDRLPSALAHETICISLSQQQKQQQRGGSFSATCPWGRRVAAQLKKGRGRHVSFKIGRLPEDTLIRSGRSLAIWFRLEF